MHRSISRWGCTSPMGLQTDAVPILTAEETLNHTRGRTHLSRNMGFAPGFALVSLGQCWRICISALARAPVPRSDSSQSAHLNHPRTGCALVSRPIRPEALDSTISSRWRNTALVASRENPRVQEAMSADRLTSMRKTMAIVAP